MKKYEEIVSTFKKGNDVTNNNIYFLCILSPHFTTHNQMAMPSLTWIVSKM